MKIIGIKKVENGKFIVDPLFNYYRTKFYPVEVTYQFLFFFKITKIFFPINVSNIIFKGNFIIRYCDISGKKISKKDSASITNYFNSIIL